MAELTYRQIERDKITLTLLVNPGTDDQLFTYKVLATRPTQMANAVAQTRAKHPEAPLGWLQPSGEIVPVIP